MWMQSSQSIQTTGIRAMRAMIHYGESRFTEALVDIEYLIKKNPDAPELAPLRVLRNRLIEQGASAP